MTVKVCPLQEVFEETIPSPAFISLSLNHGSSPLADLPSSNLPSVSLQRTDLLPRTQVPPSPFQYLPCCVLSMRYSSPWLYLPSFRKGHGPGLAYLNPKLNSRTFPGFLGIRCRPEASGYQLIPKKGPSLRKELTQRMARRGPISNDLAVFGLSLNVSDMSQ